MELRGGTWTRRVRAAGEELMLRSPGERGREQAARSPGAGACRLDRAAGRGWPW